MIALFCRRPARTRFQAGLAALARTHQRVTEETIR